MDIATLHSLSQSALNIGSEPALITPVSLGSLLSDAQQSRSTETQPALNLQGELWIMKLLIEQMTGKPIFLSHLSTEQIESPDNLLSSVKLKASASMSVHAKIETLQADTIKADFTLSSESSMQQNGQIPGKIVDPLVINLQRDFADLESAKFYFDLNADGNMNWVPSLAKGSAFLALDKNNNQQIDDGSELFGPNTGDGFTDLGRYDDDNNGHINQQDAIFAHLKVWRPDGQLLALAEVGVESISLHSQIDEQRYHNQAGQLLGIARKSAEFTDTNGNTGTMQHIDMVI